MWFLVSGSGAIELKAGAKMSKEDKAREVGFDLDTEAKAMPENEAGWRSERIRLASHFQVGRPVRLGWIGWVGWLAQRAKVMLFAQVML